MNYVERIILDDWIKEMFERERGKNKFIRHKK